MNEGDRMPLILVMALLTPLVLDAGEAGDCKPELCALVASGSLSDLRWPDFSDYRTRIQSFYEPTAYTSAWINRGSVTGAAKSIIEVLKNADAKGLDSEDYDGSRWSDRLAELTRTGKAPSESDLTRFDLALTVCAMRYISDLHFGKVNPGLFELAVSNSGFGLGDEQTDLAGFVRQRLVNATNVKAVLDGVEPPYEGYRRTEMALQRYLALARDHTEELLPVPNKPVEPGSPYVAAPKLASLLRKLEDLPAGATLPSDPNLYGGALVDAVKRFQSRHGLEPDGRLGKATVAQLNTPLSHRVRQLQLTLERWRWIPSNFPHPLIVVNIPEFVLRVLDDSYATEFEMKVVVGGAYRHQTPVFTANMKSVVFRPYWNVPTSIQHAELLPKLKRDRSYLMNNGYEVVTPQEQVVTNGTVSDDVLAQLRSGKLRVRQIPGPKNSLGLVKFLFPNEYNVYLHGTPATELFSRTRRDFSHGCIRVERPAELAAWVLRNYPEWTREHILEAMNGTEPLEVKLNRPIPVLIVYATAVALDGGEVRFFEDIYKQDADLEDVLAKGYPYRPWKPASGSLPATHPAHIDVNEIRLGVIPHAAATEGKRQVAQVGRLDAGQPNVNRLSLHVQAILGDPTGVRP